MKILDRLFIWRRIARLEKSYAEKREALEAFVERYNYNPTPPREDWGIWPEIYKIRSIIEEASP